MPLLHADDGIILFLYSCFKTDSETENATEKSSENKQRFEVSLHEMANVNWNIRKNATDWSCL